MTSSLGSGRIDALLAHDAAFETIASGFVITEGVVWHPGEDCLFFSELFTSVVYRWAADSGLTILRQPSNITNGNCLDRQGRLLSCEHATSCVSRREEGGRHFRVLATHYRGKELNSPNDIVVDSRDRIWFTDPSYGRTHPRVGVIRERELDFKGVYRLDPDGALTLVAADFEQPNGLCFLPGEGALLVNDTDRGHIRRFAVHDDGSLSGGAVIATLGGDATGKPDGMKVDAEGRIYCTGPGGIHVLTPDGTPFALIHTPELTRNFCFGGTDFGDLFLATSSRILRIRTKVQGLRPPYAGSMPG